MKTTKRPVLLLTLLPALASGPSASAAEPVRGTVEVRCPSRAVAGFPVPVQFVVDGPAELVAPRLLGETNPFQLELRSDERTYVFPPRVRRPVRHAAGVGQPSSPEVVRLPIRMTRVARGESCEFVMDLSHIPCAVERGQKPNELLAPGEYVLEFSHPDFEFDCRTGSIRILAPNEHEKKLLSQTRPPTVRAGSSSGTPPPTVGGDSALSAAAVGDAARNDRATAAGPPPRWRDFVERHRRAMSGVDTAGLSAAARRQLGYHLLLARLVGSRRPVAELRVGPDSLRGLLPGYRTEALILRYEIELARGDEAAASSTRAAIRSRRPLASGLLDYIRDHGGFIARTRKAVGKRAKPSTGGRNGGAADAPDEAGGASLPNRSPLDRRPAAF